jgi:hypothetical protein
MHITIRAKVRFEKYLIGDGSHGFALVELHLCKTDAREASGC